MTDEKFLQLVSKEIEIIKKNVLENFSCSDCKKLGLFAECQKKEKSCETIVSEWFDEVIGGNRK